MVRKHHPYYMLYKYQRKKLGNTTYTRLYYPSFSRYSTLMRFYQNHPPRRALQKCAINDFHTIKILHVRFCVFFVVSAYAVDIDAADAGVDGAGAVVHADTMTATDVGFI